MERKADAGGSTLNPQPGQPQSEIRADLFVRQVEDRALPAGQVLAEQQHGLDPGMTAQLFIP